MESSSSVNYIKNSQSHHFKFNYLEKKDLQPEQFVSSPVFHALGHEWVIDCYLRDSRIYRDGTDISFMVRLHGECNYVNPTFSFSLMKRDGTKSTLSDQSLKIDKIDLFLYAVKKSPFQQQIFAYGDHSKFSFQEDFLNDGSFELICSIHNIDTHSNRCSIGVPKSLDLHRQIGNLLGSSETTDVTFDVENRSFMCHRLILAARSPVFKAELFGYMAEATQKHVKIKDMCREAFEAMLRFIYTDSFSCCHSCCDSFSCYQQN